MQTSEQRDEKTLVIATAVGLLCLVIAVGAITVWAAVTFAGLSESTVGPLGWALTVAAGAMAIAYLVRARQR